MNFFFPHLFCTASRNIETAGVAADPRAVTGSRVIRVVDSATLFEGFADYLALLKGQTNTANAIGADARLHIRFGSGICAGDFSQSQHLLGLLPNGGYYKTPRGVYGTNRAYRLGAIETSSAPVVGYDGNDQTKVTDYLWTAAGQYGDGGVFYGDTAGVRRVVDPWPTFSRRSAINGDDVTSAWGILQRRAVLAWEVNNTYASYTAATGGGLYARSKLEELESGCTINNTWRVQLSDVPSFVDYPLCAVEFYPIQMSVYRVSTGGTSYHYGHMKIPMLTVAKTANSVSLKAATTSGSAMIPKFRSMVTSAGYNADDPDLYINVSRYNTALSVIVLDAHKMLINRLITG